MGLPSFLLELDSLSALRTLRTRNSTTFPGHLYTLARKISLPFSSAQETSPVVGYEAVPGYGTISEA